eukprot:TRINITY_DN26420_c0_g4_i1.p1 TRINITY_DN26420_c0_g4~~TRINITY_DN26420_c0_g4_i1.p1  ORF type:complete len:2641 (-),score=461.58 TRINITY_DN26420_c0_g4_i1:29-7468(-)
MGGAALGLLWLHTVQALERSRGSGGLLSAWKLVLELLCAARSCSHGGDCFFSCLLDAHGRGSSLGQIDAAEARRLLAQAAYRATSVAASIKATPTPSAPPPSSVPTPPSSVRPSAGVLADIAEFLSACSTEVSCCSGSPPGDVVGDLAREQIWIGALRCTTALHHCAVGDSAEDSSAALRCWRSVLKVLRVAFASHPAELAAAAAEAAVALQRSGGSSSCEQFFGAAERLTLLLDIWGMRPANGFRHVGDADELKRRREVEYNSTLQSWLTVVEAALGVGLNASAGVFNWSAAEHLVADAMLMLGRNNAHTLGGTDGAFSNAALVGTVCRLQLRLLLGCLASLPDGHGDVDEDATLIVQQRIAATSLAARQALARFLRVQIAIAEQPTDMQCAGGIAARVGHGKVGQGGGHLGQLLRLLDGVKRRTIAALRDGRNMPPSAQTGPPSLFSLRSTCFLQLTQVLVLGASAVAAEASREAETLTSNTQAFITALVGAAAEMFAAVSRSIEGQAAPMQEDSSQLVEVQVRAVIDVVCSEPGAALQTAMFLRRLRELMKLGVGNEARALPAWALRAVVEGVVNRLEERPLLRGDGDTTRAYDFHGSPAIGLPRLICEAARSADQLTRLRAWAIAPAAASSARGHGAASTAEFVRCLRCLAARLADLSVAHGNHRNGSESGTACAASDAVGGEAPRAASLADEVSSLLERLAAHHVALRLQAAREPLQAAGAGIAAGAPAALLCTAEPHLRRAADTAVKLLRKTATLEQHSDEQSGGASSSRQPDAGGPRRLGPLTPNFPSLAALLPVPKANAEALEVFEDCIDARALHRQQLLHVVLCRAELQALDAQRSCLYRTLRSSTVATAMVEAPTCEGALQGVLGAEQLRLACSALQVSLEIYARGGASGVVADGTRATLDVAPETLAVDFVAVCSQVVTDMLEAVDAHGLPFAGRRSLLVTALEMLGYVVEGVEVEAPSRGRSCSVVVSAKIEAIGRLRLMQAELALLLPAPSGPAGLTWRQPDSVKDSDGVNGLQDVDYERRHDLCASYYLDESLKHWRKYLSCEEFTHVVKFDEASEKVHAASLRRMVPSHLIYTAVRNLKELAHVLELLGRPLDAALALMIAFASLRRIQDETASLCRADVVLLLHCIAAALARAAPTQRFCPEDTFVGLVHSWYAAGIRAWDHLLSENGAKEYDETSVSIEIEASKLVLATAMPGVLSCENGWRAHLGKCLLPHTDLALRWAHVHALHASAEFAFSMQADFVDNSDEFGSSYASVAALGLISHALELVKELGICWSANAACLGRSCRRIVHWPVSRCIDILLRLLLHAGCLYEHLGEARWADYYYSSGLSVLLVALPAASVSVQYTWHLPFLCGRARLALAGWPLRAGAFARNEDDGRETRVESISAESSFEADIESILSHVESLWNDSIQGWPFVRMFAESNAADVDACGSGKHARPCADEAFLPPISLRQLCAAVALRRARSVQDGGDEGRCYRSGELTHWCIESARCTRITQSGGLGDVALALWHLHGRSFKLDDYCHECVMKIAADILQDGVTESSWQVHVFHDLNSIAELCLELFADVWTREAIRLGTKKSIDILALALRRASDLLHVSGIATDRVSIYNVIKMALECSRESDVDAATRITNLFEASLQLSAIVLRRAWHHGCAAPVRQAARRLATLASFAADRGAAALAQYAAARPATRRPSRQPRRRQPQVPKRCWRLWGARSRGVLRRSQAVVAPLRSARTPVPRRQQSNVATALVKQADASASCRSRAPKVRQRRLPSRASPTPAVLEAARSLEAHADAILAAAVPLSSGHAAFYLYELRAQARGPRAEKTEMSPKELSDGDWLARLPADLAVAWLQIDMDAKCVQISRLLPHRGLSTGGVENSRASDADGRVNPGPGEDNALRRSRRRFVSQRAALDVETCRGLTGLASELRSIEAARRVAEVRWSEARRQASRSDAAGDAAATAARRAAFWSEAQALDRRLAALTRRVQTEVLGDWWFLLSTGPRDEAERRALASSFSVWLKDEDISDKFLCGRRYELLLLLYIAVKETTSDIEVAGSLRAAIAADVTRCRAVCPSAGAADDTCDRLAKSLLASRRRFFAAPQPLRTADGVASACGARQLEPLLLFADASSAWLPLEACPCLTGEPVARGVAPNVALAALSLEKCAQAPLAATAPCGMSGYYVVDPYGDANTGGHVLSLLRGPDAKDSNGTRAGARGGVVSGSGGAWTWSGRVGRPGPSHADVQRALATKDLFLYMGHGEHAHRFFKPDRLERGAFFAASQALPVSTASEPTSARAAAAATAMAALPDAETALMGGAAAMPPDGGGRRVSTPVPMPQPQPLRSVVALLGCSSARLRPPLSLRPPSGCGGKHSDLVALSPSQAEECEPMAPPIRLLLGGCPAVFGALWDVFAGDLDRFADQFLRRALASSDARGGRSGDLGLLGALMAARARGRDVCMLPHLTGAALVCYGIPV